MNTPEISIVVCTQNRAEMLRGALASLYDLATDGFTYEIVVVDNGSTDPTQQSIAAAAAKSRQPLRGIYEPEKGIVPARNRGIREAQGRWIAFFDDDQLADANWLAELYRGAAQKNCRVVGGDVHLTFPQGCTRRLDPIVRMLLGEARHGQAPLPYGGRLTPGCGNLMIERTVFDEVGVFLRTVSGRGEDTDLFSRIERAGISGWYFPSAIVHHITPPERLRTEYLLSLAHRMGEGIALRQAEHLGRGRFAALWLAKAARLALSQAPWAAVWGCCGHHEAWLGRRCLLAINGSFLRSGRRLLFSRPARESSRAKRTAEYSVLSTQYSVPNASPPGYTSIQNH